MDFESNFDEKIDVIDLIINVLKEHEKKLDELVTRLENQEPSGTSKMKTTHIAARNALFINQWNEFCEYARSSDLVTFDSKDEHLHVSALSQEIIYTYTEQIPFLEIRYTNFEGKAQISSLDISSAELLFNALQSKLNCGLVLKKNFYETSTSESESKFSIDYSIDPEIARQWLAYQLGVDEIKIVNGSLKI